MLRVLTMVTLILCLVGTTSAARAADAPPLNDAQKGQVDEMIRTFIMNNPQVVIEFSRKYQTEQQAAEEAERAKRIADLKQEAERSPSSPIIGNAAGDVTIVEFFDYNCPYCKQVHDAVMQAVKADGKVRFVYKEWPILGPDSVSAAKAALGVFYHAPEKYAAFGDALMRNKGRLSEARIYELAATAGLDPKAVRKYADDPRVMSEIERNHSIAGEIGLNGTPSFLVNGKIVPNAVDREALETLIAEARKG